MLVLTETTRETALKKLEELRVRAAHMVIRHEGKKLPPIQISIGLAIYPDHGRTFEDLIRKADIALYRAKEAGRNRIEVVNGIEASALTKVH